MNNTYQPYTYLITFLLTGQRYYGVRTKKNCTPDDLWHTYFTSSNIIKQLINEHGVDAFRVEVRKTFSTKQEAILWEHKVLSRIDAAHNPLFLNKNNGSRKFIPHDKHSKETKRKIGIAHKGKTMSEEAKEKMRNTCIERFGDTPPWQSKESNMKRSKSSRGRTPWNKGKTMPYKGRTSPTKGLRWYNNGVEQFFVKECPPGCVRGKLR